MKRAIIIIGEIMKYIYLDNNFYNRHPQINYPEILQKKDRPYVQIAISVNNQLWAIPLRSNINHNYVFWSDKKNKCGIDFTKAVPIDHKDINTNRHPSIRQNEFNALKGKEHSVIKSFKGFIKKYNHSKQHPNLPESKVILRYSTLQYFENYLLPQKKVQLNIVRNKNGHSL